MIFIIKSDPKASPNLFKDPNNKSPQTFGSDGFDLDKHRDTQQNYAQDGATENESYPALDSHVSLTPRAPPN